MSFTYKFPAVKGLQASKEYFITMIPLGLLSRLFGNEDDYLLPEYRAQRRINELRIPEIRDYILANPTNYVFSALSASIDGKFSYLHSELDDIPGIGEKTQAQLLKDFKSVKRIKEADVEQLIESIGKSKGMLVHNYFHKSYEKESL